MNKAVKINGELVSLDNVRIITNIGKENFDNFRDAEFDDLLSFNIIYTDGTEYIVKFPDVIVDTYNEEQVIHKLNNVRDKLIKMLYSVYVTELINIQKD